MIAAAPRINQVAGDHQQTQHDEHRDPGKRAEMGDAHRSKTAEQARQAEGANAGHQLLAGAFTPAPATLGADQQPDAQRRGEVEEEVQGHWPPW